MPRSESFSLQDLRAVSCTILRTSSVTDRCFFVEALEILNTGIEAQSDTPYPLVELSYDGCTVRIRAERDVTISEPTTANAVSNGFSETEWGRTRRAVTAGRRLMGQADICVSLGYLSLQRRHARMRRRGALRSTNGSRIGVVSDTNSFHAVRESRS